MSTNNKKPKAKPKARPPRATVPPKASRPFAMRPIAASPAQRSKRRASRATGTLTASVDGDEGSLDLYGTIGDDFWGEGVTAVKFKQSLKDLGNVSSIVLDVNSGGGDVFDATDIYNMLVRHPAKVHVRIGGVAASAATLIAMAGDTISIAENAHFMIHRASGGVWGNDDDVESYLKLLRNANEMLQLTYSRRTGMDKSQLVSMMRTDNWMTAQEALDHGFVEALDEAKAVTPHVSPGASAAPSHKFVDSERLAAMAHSLSIAASVSQPGSSPQPVSPVTHKEPKKMNATLRAKCIAAGMAETLDDATADTWFEANTEKVFAAKAAPKVEPKELTAGDVTAAIKEANRIAAEERKAWKKEVDANLSLAFGDRIPGDLKAECYELQDEGLEAVRTKIQDTRKAAPSLGVVRFSDSQPRDRHLAAIKDGVAVRALGAEANKRLPVDKRAKDHEQFARMPLLRVAEECLLVDGLSHEEIRRMSGTEIAQAAFTQEHQSRVRADAGLHTTGSLLEITKDAINKNLLGAYEEAPQTWRGPILQGTSVPDFKEKHVIKLSAAPNLPVWIDGQPPQPVKVANERDHYAVEARAEGISFSWKLVVNDDMNALSRIPQLLGNAAARTVNAVAWAAVTANPTLPDGQAMFLATATGNRKRSNLTTGSASPTNTTITAMRTKMRLFRGLNTPEGAESEDILNLTPDYIAVPAALEGIVLQQQLSMADPAASGNAGVLNLTKFYGMTLVVEPLLDATSTTAWYIVASPNKVDGVELSFLQGQETPVTFSAVDFKTMAQEFTIVQSYAAKAIDYRGWVRHDGA